MLKHRARKEVYRASLCPGWNVATFHGWITEVVSLYHHLAIFARLYAVDLLSKVAIKCAMNNACIDAKALEESQQKHQARRVHLQ